MNSKVYEDNLEVMMIAMYESNLISKACEQYQRRINDQQRNKLFLEYWICFSDLTDNESSFFQLRNNELQG